MGLLHHKAAGEKSAGAVEVWRPWLVSKAILSPPASTPKHPSSSGFWEPRHLFTEVSGQPPWWEHLCFSLTGLFIHGL